MLPRQQTPSIHSGPYRVPETTLEAPTALTLAVPHTESPGGGDHAHLPTHAFTDACIFMPVWDHFVCAISFIVLHFKMEPHLTAPGTEQAFIKYLSMSEKRVASIRFIFIVQIYMHVGEQTHTLRCSLQ